ncbi:MAG: putative 2-dehydropantoate 2-reductase [Kiritimatiellales bacterium]
MKSFAIIGTGGIGGFFGGLLQRGGLEVHFLLHSDYEFVKKNGLTIESAHGDFNLPQVNAYNDPKKMPACDVTLIALKTTQNSLLPGILPHTVKDNGIAISLQNGLGNEEAVASIVGAERTAGGSCFIGSTKMAPGLIRHTDAGQITLGEYRTDGAPAGITPRLQRLGGVMKNAGVNVVLAEDLPLVRWKKLCWNIPFNGTSVVKNALTDELAGNPELRALCLKLMEEVAAGSAAVARPVAPEFLDQMMAYTESMTAYAPSMRVDYDHGRPMEIESIYGAPVRMAGAAGVAMPETEKLYNELITLEKEQLK